MITEKIIQSEFHDFWLLPDLEEKNIEIIEENYCWIVVVKVMFRLSHVDVMWSSNIYLHVRKHKFDLIKVNNEIKDVKQQKYLDSTLTLNGIPIVYLLPITAEEWIHFKVGWKW